MCCEYCVAELTQSKSVANQRNCAALRAADIVWQMPDKFTSTIGARSVAKKNPPYFYEGQTKLTNT
jgi:hypothetical protein